MELQPTVAGTIEDDVSDVSDRMHLHQACVRLYYVLKANAYMSAILRTSKDFGALIRDRRRARGLSQQALADAVGVSRLWVNQVERGKPRAELALVLRALDVLHVRLTAEDRQDETGLSDIDSVVDRARRRKP